MSPSKPEEDHPLRKPQFEAVYSDEHGSKIEGSILYKRFVGAAFFALVTIVLMVHGWIAVAKCDPNIPWRILGYIFVGAVIFGGFLGATFGLRDRILKKANLGWPVSPLLLFLARDGWILLIPMIVVTVFIVTMASL